MATPPPPSLAHEEVDPVIISVLSVGLAAGLLAALHFSVNCRAVRVPTLTEVAGTIACFNGSTSSNPIRQASLACFRLVILAWFLVVDVYHLLEEPFLGGPKPKHPLFFFTVWNFNLQVLFFAVAFFASAAHLLRGACPWQPAICGATHRLFSICLPSSLLVALIEWTLLFPNDTTDDQQAADLSVTSFTAHGINAFALLIELFVNQMVVRPAHLVYPLAWASAYVVFTWIQQQTFGGVWPYFFMPLDTYVAFGWYALVFVAYLLAYALTVGLSQLKARLSGLEIDGPALGCAQAARDLLSVLPTAAAEAFLPPALEEPKAKAHTSSLLVEPMP